MTQFPLTSEQFTSFRTAFRALSNSRSLTAEDILLYNFVRDLPLTRGFTKITNYTKLENGQDTNLGFQTSVRRIRRTDVKNISKRFNDSIPEDIYANWIRGMK